MFAPNAGQKTLQAGDTLPDGTVVEHNERLDWMRDAASAIKDVASEPFSAIKDIASDPLGRDYATEEAVKARDYQTDERLAAEAFSSAEAEKARQHSLMLAETEYSRKVQSMRDAGLNPILAAGGWGAGSQVPSSAQAQSHGGGGVQAHSPMAPLQALLLAAQIRDISSASKLKDEQAKDLAITRDPRVNEISERIELFKEQIIETRVTVQQKQQLTDNLAQEWRILQSKLESAKSQAEIDKAIAEFQTTAGGAISRWTDAVGVKGRDVMHLLGGFGVIMRLLKKDPAFIRVNNPFVPFHDFK